MFTLLKYTSILYYRIEFFEFQGFWSQFSRSDTQFPSFQDLFENWISRISRLSRLCTNPDTHRSRTVNFHFQSFVSHRLSSAGRGANDGIAAKIQTQDVFKKSHTVFLESKLLENQQFPFEFANVARRSSSYHFILIKTCQEKLPSWLML